ncbi:MAG: hypothetical protein J6E46_09535 [Faecalicoccus sp.]|nr:hypothetical protein [Faecalicoccus sp.]
MAGKIIVFICCILCHLPWLYISTFQKNSEEPISFWSGDQSLKQKVKDVKNYNLEMATLYRKFSWLYLLCAILAPFNPIYAIGLLCIGSLIGIYFVYKSYKKILERYS